MVKAVFGVRQILCRRELYLHVEADCIAGAARCLRSFPIWFYGPNSCRIAIMCKVFAFANTDFEHISGQIAHQAGAPTNQI